MRRVVCLLVVAACVIGSPLLGGMRGWERHGLSVGDLQGDYLFVTTHVVIDTQSGLIDHCEVAGTLSFDGAGTVTAIGTEKCEIQGVVTFDETHPYVVNRDGTGFLVLESEQDPDPISLRPTGDLKILLLDGLQGTNPNDLIFNGIAVRANGRR